MFRTSSPAIVFALLSLLAACEREEEMTVPERSGEIIITAGFDTPGSGTQEADTRTYVMNGTQVRWSPSDVDKVLYVFDTRGVKNVFTSLTPSAGTIRRFSGTISPDSEIALILWSGKKSGRRRERPE